MACIKSLKSLQLENQTLRFDMYLGEILLYPKPGNPCLQLLFLSPTLWDYPKPSCQFLI